MYNMQITPLIIIIIVSLDLESIILGSVEWRPNTSHTLASTLDRILVLVCPSSSAVSNVLDLLSDFAWSEVANTDGLGLAVHKLALDNGMP